MAAKLGSSFSCISTLRLLLNQRESPSPRNATRQSVLRATAQDEAQWSEVKSDKLEPDHNSIETLSPSNKSFNQSQRTDGKPGLVSFSNLSYKTEDAVIKSNLQKENSSLLWFVGHAVPVASFIFPSLYLRRILSTVFVDSLLTDFLILFFTEAIFYCGVAVFLLLIYYIRRPKELESAENG